MSAISAKTLANLNAKGRIIVTLDGARVYDVTDFVADHPGGDDLIVDLKNTDVTEIMADPVSHVHSESAYELLDEYFLGVLADSAAEDAALDEDSEELLNAETDIARDYKENQFLDLNKPLLLQVLFGNFTREFYIDQVHKPRHYGKGSAPIFGNFLEPLSLTPWWVIPIVWIPVNMYVISVALQGLPFYTVGVLYAFGLFLWTLVEYVMHRFLFHVDDHLPESQIAFTLHFLLHGVHHYLPMDRMRLVMPPALMVVLATPLYKLCHFIFRSYYPSQAIFAGAHMGYIIYDCTHYFLHHKQLPQFMKPTKAHHLDHHYKNYELGFGVTSKFWDVVFGTTLVDTSKRASDKASAK